jgi:L-galactono-1,4-lactone dehydrogenase
LQQHWAKIEVPSDPVAKAKLQERLAKRFPVDLFNALRQMLDPKGVMSNNVIDVLFGNVK